MTPEIINLDNEEKRIYLRCLTYVMQIRQSMEIKQSRKEIFLENQVREVGLPLEELKNIKVIKKAEDIICELKKIHNVKAKRYILREMILLAIADHELNDKEISTIYQIGVQSGIKEEKISDFFMWAANGVEWQINGIKLVEEDL